MVTDIVFYFISFRITHFTSILLILTIPRNPKFQRGTEHLIKCYPRLLISYLTSCAPISMWKKCPDDFIKSFDMHLASSRRHLARGGVCGVCCVQWWCADRDHDYLLPPFVIVLTESESIHSSLAYLMQRLKWVHCKWLYFMLLAQKLL